MRKIKKTNKSRKRQEKILNAILASPSQEERTKNLPVPAIAPLDHLGRKNPDYQPGRRTTVIEDSDLKLPELWLSVFVHGPEAGANFNKMFGRSKCFKADSPDDADLVVFSGSGHDVDPQLYGQPAHKSTAVNANIDKSNITLYGFCASRGIPMFGVCGGAQILHVMQGGELYQDVDGHNQPHSIFTVADKLFIQRVSSVHHQMCVENDQMEVLATAHKSTERWLNNNQVDRGTAKDVEAFFYRDRCILGVQGHPEYSGYPKYTQWVLEQIDHHLNTNPDLEYRPNDEGRNKLRIKKDLMVGADGSKSIITLPSEDMIIVEQKG